MTIVAPTPTMSTVVDGQLLAAADLNSWTTHLSGLYSRLVGGFRTRKPLVVIGNSTGSSYSTAGTLYAVPFGVERVDTDAMWRPDFPTWIYIRTAGWYRLIFQVHWDNTTGGYRTIRLAVNGTAPSNEVGHDCRPALSSGEGTITFCEALVRLTADSYVYPLLQHGAAGAAAIVANLSGTFAAAEWVAPY